MASTIENTLNKVGNVVQDILNGTKDTPPQIRISNSTKQTCLEKIGMVARSQQLFKNEWKKDFQYTKPLIDSEYSVQTEFLVS